jgi:hypothetical protein
MNINYNVPFCANTQDNTHCFQAVLKMILKYYWSEKEFSWKELDRITEKKDGLWTFAAFGWLWLKEQGVEIRVIEDFDYKKFADTGIAYFIEEYGDEVAQEQNKHTDIVQGQHAAIRVMNELPVEKRIPTIKDIVSFIEKGYLVCCNVNSKKLNNQSGYDGHFVLIKGHNENKLILHDPGLPPQENRHVDFKAFENAWAYAGDKAKNVVACKQKR